MTSKKKKIEPVIVVRAIEKKLFKDAMLLNIRDQLDPVDWIEANLGVELYSNQIQNIEHLFSSDNTGFNILAARGAGKTWGLAAGLLAYGKLYPGLRIIIVGPKEKQAARILKEIYTILKSKGCKIGHEIDEKASGAHRIQFKNGSYMVALSGQEVANVEGEHGHILVIDEAHKVPTYSMTNKLAPMVGMLEFTKIIKIGVAMGKNHFHKSCTAPGAIVDKCTWDKAEIFLAKESKKQPAIFYKGKQYARVLIGRIPLPYKKKYFPDRPDLQRITGNEISVLDWEMQYELIWADDILNFLSDDDQKTLFSGKHDLLTKGALGELYCAGLDTAQGSITGRKNTDETVLSIWRMRGQKKERVASYIWKGDPLQQMEEIWQIIHPNTGLFRCKMTLVDYSNIGITTVDLFKANKVPILGRHFQATEPRSKKNWKNALYDYFLVQLQTEKLFYPNTAELEKQEIDAKGPILVQIKNALRGFWEWCDLIRIRGKGLNDKIQAPDDNVEGEDGEGGEGGRAFDDVCLSGDTCIKLLDGTTSTMMELAERSSLEDVWVYSLDKDSNIVPGKVTRAWKTGHRNTLTITLDNGESFRCTPEHLIMLRDGSYLRADELLPGASVMPLYTKKEKISKKTSDYEKVYNPATETYQFTHRLVAGIKKKKVIHHVNFNRFDNTPKNLRHMGVFEHIRLHGDNARENNARMWGALGKEERSKRASKAWAGTTKEDRQRILQPACEAVRARMQDPEKKKEQADKGRRILELMRSSPKYLEQCSKNMRNRWGRASSSERKAMMAPAQAAAIKWHNTHPSHRKGEHKQWFGKTCELSDCANLLECRVSAPKRFCSKKHSAVWRETSGLGQKGKPAWNRGFKNHKVISICAGLTEDVYDLTVEGHHNFALACGVFVHNCTADILAIWALDHVAELEQEIAHGGDLSHYEIPSGVFGPTSLSSMVPMAGGQAAPPPGRNPMAMSEGVSRGSTGGPAPTTKAGELQSWLSNVLIPGKK